ncbi:conserved membrane protein [Chlamydia psittaci VS225]|nr:conserved membrane protein [Chlamydia psittaci VS225]
MSVFLNPSNSQPTPSYPPPLSCCQHITTCIKEASYCSLFSTIFSKIVSTWGGENLESFLGYLTIALACLTSALISLILYVLLIPVKLVVAVITLPCCRKTQRTSLLPETPKVVIPLTETQEAFVEEVKQSILQNLTNEFEMNTSEDILSLVPIPSPFLTSLETASCERISCNYKKLIRLINNLNCWDAGWGNIMNYLTVELSEDPSHPDAQTFPIIMHHLILALEDRDISTEKNALLLMKSLRMQICADLLGVKQFSGR